MNHFFFFKKSKIKINSIHHSRFGFGFGISLGFNPLYTARTCDFGFGFGLGFGFCFLWPGIVYNSNQKNITALNTEQTFADFFPNEDGPKVASRRPLQSILPLLFQQPARLPAHFLAGPVVGPRQAAPL